MDAGAVTRPIRDGDIPAIVDLLNSVLPVEERITVEEFRHQETFRNPEESRQRLVVETAERVVAMAEAANRLSRPLHKFYLTLAVDPGFRRRGMGTDLERRHRGLCADARRNRDDRDDPRGRRAFSHEWVGTSGIFVPEGRPGYTYFTGVRREYRGRGLATALKLATIEYARDHGVRAMRTTNDTANNAMVAVNEKLGYRRLPGRVAMRLSW